MIKNCLYLSNVLDNNTDVYLTETCFVFVIKNDSAIECQSSEEIEI